MTWSITAPTSARTSCVMSAPRLAAHPGRGPAGWHPSSAPPWAGGPSDPERARGTVTATSQSGPPTSSVPSPDPASGRVAPGPAVPGDQCAGLGGTPGRCLVEGDGAPVAGPVLHDRVDDAPGAADLVGPDEEGGVADQRVQDDPLVGIGGLLLEALVREVHRRLLHPEGVSGHLRAEAEAQALVGLHAHDQGVGVQPLRRPG